MKKNQGVIDRSVQSDVNRALSRANQSLGGASIVKRMTLVSSVTTNGTGTYLFQLRSGNVQNLPATEWNSFSTRYIDYRVLKMKVSYMPIRCNNTRNAATSLDLAPVGVAASDPSGSATPVTLQQGWALELSKLFSLERPWKIAIRASQEEHMLFNPTTAIIPSANTFSIVGVFGGGDASTVYGNVFYEWWVELRGSQ